MLAADLVIQGTVLTVDELQPTAEASAVSDGRIIAVGERADIESWIGPGTEVIDMYEDALRRWPRDDHPLRPSGRVLAPGERLTVEQAIRAQTIDAAWLLLADDVVGSLEVSTTPKWWCCRRIRAPCRRRRSQISKCGRRSWRVGRFTRKATEPTAAVARF